MPSIPAPMRASQGGKPFTSDDWIYELKYDGYRCMAQAGGDAGAVELRTKQGVECSAWFPEVATLLGELKDGPHIIDGEIVVLDEVGRADFNRLQERARARRWYPGCPPVVFCAFDILYAKGKNVMNLPLMARKDLLNEVLKPLLPRLIVVGDFPAQAGLFAEVVEPLKIEGFVAKRRASTYQPGVVSPDWRKIKRPGWQEGRKWKG